MTQKPRLSNYIDSELIDELVQRGYFVHHTKDFKCKLVWSRMEPFPHGMDMAKFKEEGLEQIRKQVDMLMLTHITQNLQAIEGVDFAPTKVHQLSIRVF